MSQNEGGKLRKEIGVFGGVSLVAGMTIGSGIYYLGSYVLERTNMSQGAALLCWIIGGIVSILGGLCFAELGAEMPVQGGMTTYLSRAYHPCVGFVNGFSGFLLTASGSIASLAMASVIPFQEEFQLTELQTKIIAIAIIAFFTWFNLRGVKSASRFQDFTMVVRVIPLILVIVLGVFAGKEHVDLSVAGAFQGNVSIGNCIKVIGYATFASLWAYEGWTNLNTVAGEMKRPKRDLPLAIILSMGFITLVYTLFNFAIYRVIPSAEVNSMIQSGSIYLGKETAYRVMGHFGKWIVMIGMCVGIIGTVNGDCLVFPRTYYAMAKGGYFWKSFGTLNKNGVPQVSMLWSSGIAIVLVIFNSLQSLTDLLVTTSALLNMMAVIAVLIFRKKYPDMERPYKVWGGVPVICLTIVFFAVLLINNLVSDLKGSLLGFLIPVLCVPFYFYFRKKNGGVDYSGDDSELE